MSNFLGNVAMPPYALALQIAATGQEDGLPVLRMPFRDEVLGRPGFLHGGAISGLLEIASMAALYSALAAEALEMRIKPVNVTVDFMRGGIDHDTFAVGRITRLGRTMANVEAVAWQDDRNRLIASAQMHYLLRTPKA
ncbi:PaaI family thioesterase [Novosphingopyxis baekryungensis]|uniref:PaaI family thioesterase n=1 Tax=Novosphingopyxis baekryungensis TaxID=279369 RepID=UPI0003B37C02|nr:PaaI family thioesterase [Novosphingopyxis baekryungensis]